MAGQNAGGFGRCQLPLGYRLWLLTLSGLAPGFFWAYPRSRSGSAWPLDERPVFPNGIPIDISLIPTFRSCFFCVTGPASDAAWAKLCVSSASQCSRGL